MFYFLLTLLLPSVMATWPPLDCPAPISVSDNVLVLSNYRTRNVNTKCELDEVYSDVVFVQFGRYYKHSESIVARMNFEFMFGDVLGFGIDLDNDKLQVNSVKGDYGCEAVLSSNTEDFKSWMRVRINHLREIDKTFVSVDLKSSADLHFTPCARFEVQYTEPTFRLNVGAYVESDVKQEIYVITDTMPHFKTDADSSQKRLARLEHKVSRLQNTLSLYMTYHDEHVSHTKAQAESLRSYTVQTKNGLEYSARSQTIIWLAIFVFAGGGVCAFVSFRIKYEKRFHLL